MLVTAPPHAVSSDRGQARPPTQQAFAGWSHSRRSASLGQKLQPDIPNVVLDLVQRVHRDPRERSLGGAGIVVHDRPVPVIDLEPRQHIGEESGSVTELTRHVRRVLIRVAVVLGPFVTPHRLQGRGSSSAGKKYPLSLNEKNVAHMTCVLERRPSRRLAPRPDVGTRLANDPAESGSALDDGRPGPPRIRNVVDESTVGAPLHRVNVPPRRATGPALEGGRPLTLLTLTYGQGSRCTTWTISCRSASSPTDRACRRNG